MNRRFKTKKERLTHLEFIRKALEEVLKEGFNPYEKGLTISAYSCEEALDYALSLKKQSIGIQTYRDYGRIKPTISASSTQETVRSKI